MRYREENGAAFSVLMAVYYREKPQSFRVALESITTYQTIKPSEIVLVEDGPLTQELYDVIIDFRKNNASVLKSVRLDKNMGLATALKVGLEECTNDIVARMDSDDISVEDRFEKQLKVMLTGHFDVVGSNTLYFDDNTKAIVGIKKNPETMDEVLVYAKRRSPVGHVTAMFKKESVLSVGSYENVLQFEDYWLWIRMIMAGMKFYSIQEPLVLVRYNDSMLERRGGIKYMKLEWEFLKRARKEGFFSTREYLFNLVTRTSARILPGSIRSLLYSKIMRRPVQSVVSRKTFDILKERGVF
ncbi:MAG TPA: glycosyltransferase [Mesotoga infera]|nr:glycosyltransferase [Mesotoga infera]HRV02960.1 glycosyltransferase [Mesotoga sp.]